MKKTRTITALAVAGLTFALAGCSSSSGSASAGGTATIKFAHWGNNQEAKTIAAMIAAFQKANPTVKVQDNWIQSDYQQKLTTSHRRRPGPRRRADIEYDARRPAVGIPAGHGHDVGLLHGKHPQRAEGGRPVLRRAVS